jgi:hypothetical protein
VYAERIVIPLTTDASGDCTAYSDRNVTGRVLTVRYVKTDFADGVDFTVTAEATGESIWAESNVNASATRAPRQATHSTAGAAALYAAGGTAVNDHLVLANDRIKVVVAQGGNVKTGALHVVIG